MKKFKIKRNDGLLATVAVVLFCAGALLSPWYIATLFVLSMFLALFSGLLCFSKPRQGKLDDKDEEDDDGCDDDSDSGA